MTAARRTSRAAEIQAYLVQSPRAGAGVGANAGAGVDMGAGVGAVTNGGGGSAMGAEVGVVAGAGAGAAAVGSASSGPRLTLEELDIGTVFGTSILAMNR